MAKRGALSSPAGWHFLCGLLVSEYSLHHLPPYSGQKSAGNHIIRRCLNHLVQAPLCLPLFQANKISIKYTTNLPYENKSLVNITKLRLFSFFYGKAIDFFRQMWFNSVWFSNRKLWNLVNKNKPFFFCSLFFQGNTKGNTKKFNENNLFAYGTWLKGWCSKSFLFLFEFRRISLPVRKFPPYGRKRTWAKKSLVIPCPAWIRDISFNLSM